MCEPRRSDCKAVILKPTNHAKFFYLAVVLLLAAYAFLSNMSINVYVVRSTQQTGKTGKGALTELTKMGRTGL